MTEHALIGHNEALIDPQVLYESLDQIGPEGSLAVRGIVDTYMHEAPAVLEDLGDALAKIDLPTAIQLTHKLRNCSLAVGARRLATRCAELEATCRFGALPHPATYAAIVADFTDTRLALKVYMREFA